MNLLECTNLSKTYGSLRALDNVSLTLKPGRIYGLLGPNGHGKSTLIKTINDLIVPDAGSVTFEGKPLGPESHAEISYLPERTYLDPTWKVNQVLDYFEDFYSNFNRKKAEQLLQSLNLSTGRKIHEMSKGMQEKLQLVLVMARDAKLYILDEPLGGVDPAARDYILDTILSNFAEGSSVLISTHLIADIEKILDEVIFIRDGRIILQQEADALRDAEDASIDDIFRRTFR